MNIYGYFWERSELNKWFSLDEIMNGISKQGLKIAQFPSIEIDKYLPDGLIGLLPSTAYIETKVSG